MTLGYVAMATPNPSQHPLAAPTVSEPTITVDTMLQQPTRITSILLDLTLQRFFADRLFTSAGGVTGGAVVYDQPIANDLYSNRDVERVAPGAEFPIVTSERRAPKVAEVEKWGGKFYITDEARDRNDASVFANETRRLANTIVRKVNVRSVEVLEAAIAANGGQSTMAGHSWSAAIPNGTNPTAPASTPGADFAAVQLAADQRELGLTFDLWVVNPIQMNSLRLFYGKDLSGVLEDNGINEMYVSNRVAAGSAYAASSGNVGQMRLEQPLATETEREGAPLMRQRTWVQSSVRPLLFVQNPYAIMKVTGLS